MEDKQRIIVLAPHTDDGELGCGGSIVKYIEEGHEVYYVTFSSCRESVPKGLPKNTLEVEVRAATKVLGIDENHLILFKYPVRHFWEHRQNILEDMVKIQRKINPSLIFMPLHNDLHQDHQIIANEGLRAFKKSSILAYEMPWNNISFRTEAFIKLNDSHIERKIKALKEYKSQKSRTYINEQFVRSLSYTRAVSVGAEYAEAFEVVRWIIS